MLMKRSVLRRATRAALFASAAVLAAGVSQASAALTLTGGLTLAEQGGGFDPMATNLAGASQGAIPFTSSDLGPVIPVPFHRAINVNDETYGNSNSWIGNDPAPVAGVAFDGTATIASFAMGRDNLGMFSDRSLGLYTLQYTTTPSPDSSTSAWTTIGTLNYGAAGGGNYSAPALRHRFNFAPINDVTGVRLLTPAGAALDELELYSSQLAPPPNLVLSPSAGFSLGFNGNNGDFSTSASPAPAPLNLASVGMGAIPLGSSELGPAIGTAPPTHYISAINDQQYGNRSSWIGNDGDANPFVGVAFDGMVQMTHIAFGRDNGDGTDPCGACSDRNLGLYTLQYTQLADPTAATPETGDATTGWASLGTVNYLNAQPGVFDPALRHQFTVSQGGNPISATGVRIKPPGTGIGAGTAIDEVEVYGIGLTPPPPPGQLVLTPAAGFSIGWDGNNGAHGDPSTGASVPDNFALASRGAIAIGSSELGPAIGLPPPKHYIVAINDGNYGNANSWIGGDGDAAPFIGVAFDGPVQMDKIAFGRDNGNEVTDDCGGTCLDRNLGVYGLQYTQVANPDGTTPLTGDPATGWASIGTVDIRGNKPGVFDAHLRHEFTIAEGGSPILATGFRLIPPGSGIGANGTAIDELEVYGRAAVPEPSTFALAGMGAIGLLAARRRRK
jgi:hypothetical protein